MTSLPPSFPAARPALERADQLILHGAQSRQRFGVAPHDLDELTDLHAVAEDPRVRLVELPVPLLALPPLPKPHRAHHAGGAEAGQWSDRVRGLCEEEHGSPLFNEAMGR